MHKCYLYYSVISVLVYFSASIVFYMVYRNIQGGIWAGLAALIATECFLLHRLYFVKRLQLYYSQQTLNGLHFISFIIVLISSAFLIWYAFTMVYWKIPLFEYEKTPIFPFVFSFISGKWGLHMYQATKEYSKCFDSNYSPISDNFAQTV